MVTADERFVAVSKTSWEDVFPRLEQCGITRSCTASQAQDKLAQFVAALPAAEAVRTLCQSGLLASTVHSVADIVRHPHVWSRGNLVRLPDPQRGEVVTQGVMPILSRTPGRVAGWSAYPGSDNDAVFGEILGYTPEQIRHVTDPEQADNL